MRCMVFMIPSPNSDAEQGRMPDPKTIERMMQFNEELTKAGILLALDGLKPSSHGARIRFADGPGDVARGPFTGAHDLVGGYWIWQVRSLDEAIEWARRCPAADGDTLEVRPIWELSDFPAEVAASPTTQNVQRGLAETQNRS